MGKKRFKLKGKYDLLSILSKGKYIFLSILGIILIIGATVGVVFLINESYKSNSGYVTMWNASDILSFYGSFLSFIATLILGLIAVYQNKKLHDMNNQLEKLEEIQYISMVTIKKIYCCSRSYEDQKFTNFDINMDNLEIIDLSSDDKSIDAYIIDVEILNESQYPIVEIEIHPGERGSAAGLFYRMKPYINQSIYIGKEDKVYLRFIIPKSEYFKISETKDMQLSLDFINIFNYRTSTSLFIYDMDKKYHANYKFRLSKFIDVRPNRK